MQGRRAGCLVLLLFVTAIPLTFAWVISEGRHQAWIRQYLENKLNAEAQQQFGGSVTIGGAHLDRRLELTLSDIALEIPLNNRPKTVRIASIKTDDPVSEWFFEAPMIFVFKQARPAAAPEDRLDGTVYFQRGENWQVRIDAEVLRLGLESLARLNPDVFQGASGDLSGQIRLLLQAGQDPEFSGELKVLEPGGKIHTRFFTLLKPYLPNTDQVSAISGSDRLVDYRNTNIEIAWPKPDEFKIFLHMEVPAYNLILNLNLTLRVDDLRGLLDQMPVG